jgi:DNA-binding transcriptional LysR family regulator
MATRPADASAARLLPSSCTSLACVPFRIAFVPGVTPGKWSRIWAQRERGTPLELVPTGESDQVSVLRERLVDMSFVRLPTDHEGLELIPLYRELPVVVVPLEHPVAAYDEVAVADLADEHLLQDPDTVPEWRDVAVEVRDGTRPELPAMTTREAIETVAAGTGIVILPMSVARLHHRKDLTYRPVTDVAESQIGLAWLSGTTDRRIETFIGIVRGRTERSSRAGDTVVPSAKAAAKKAAPRTARTKPGPRSGKGRPTRRGGGGRRG